jgi:exosortase E/protease (VPEID-CTERM system)
VPAELTAPATYRRIDDLFTRLAGLAALWAIELLLLSVWLDTNWIAGRSGLVAIVADWGPQLVSALVAALAATSVLAYVGAGAMLVGVSRDLTGSRISTALLSAHVVLMAISVALARAVFLGSIAGLPDDLVAAVWLTTGIVAALLAGAAFIPLVRWLELFHATKTALIFGAATALVSLLLRRFTEELWQPASRATFNIISTLLTPFVPGFVADPSKYLIESPTFGVIIAKECSGLEGAALMLMFGGLWLAFFRKEYRFPRALILLPVGLAVLWTTNIIRITLLFLIGHAGWVDVAAGGFHSQAGWIAFVSVALGLLAVSHRVAWLRRDLPATATVEHASAHDVEAYLVPLLVIIAAGMLSGALSGAFEWLYPLRVVAAMAVLWAFRARYRALDWGWDWVAPVAGVIVFLIWRVPELIAGPAVEAGMPAALEVAGPAVVIIWMTLRTVGAVITVPIAEELAFRGYLMRRLATAEFVRLSFQQVPAWAVLVSSTAFGALHGGRIVEGVLAGLIYAWVIRRRGRMGDAVVAHATTNALIAAGVVFNGEWRFWSARAEAPKKNAAGGYGPPAALEKRKPID